MPKYSIKSVRDVRFLKNFLKLLKQGTLNSLAQWHENSHTKTHLPYSVITKPGNLSLAVSRTLLASTMLQLPSSTEHTAPSSGPNLLPKSPPPPLH
jgi:hypothetical protein